MLRIMLVAISLISSLVFVSPAAHAVALPIGEDATVVRVIDGDTIQVAINRKRVTVRYIGIDAPENARSNQPVQCFAKEATAFNRKLVGGQKVRLESDVNDVDKFNRLLRYVYLQDGRMVNEELVKAGYAQASTYPPDVKHQDRLTTAQQVAVEAKAGLWSACAVLVDQAAAPAPLTIPAAASANAGVAPAANNCEPSCPTLCIPIGSPDLDCPDISQRRFPVLPPDPHRFDGDKDGIGCEK